MHAPRDCSMYRLLESVTLDTIATSAFGFDTDNFGSDGEHSYLKTARKVFKKLGTPTRWFKFFFFFMRECRLRVRMRSSVTSALGSPVDSESRVGAHKSPPTKRKLGRIVCSPTPSMWNSS